MNLGLSCYTLWGMGGFWGNPPDKYTLEESLRLIAEWGFCFTEVSVPPERLHDAEAVEHLKTSCDEAALKVSSITGHLGQFGSLDEKENQEAMENLKLVIRLAQEMNCEMICVRTARTQPGQEKRQIAQAANTFAAVLPLAEQNNITITIEPAPGQIAGKAGNALALCEQVKHRLFGIAFDPSNILAAGNDVAQAIRLLYPHISMVHFRDVCKTQDKFDMSCMVGEGDVDWGEFFAELKNYNGLYLLELLPMCFSQWKGTIESGVMEVKTLMEKFWTISKQD